MVIVHLPGPLRCWHWRTSSGTRASLPAAKRGGCARSAYQTTCAPTRATHPCPRRPALLAHWRAGQDVTKVSAETETLAAEAAQRQRPAQRESHAAHSKGFLAGPGSWAVVAELSRNGAVVRQPCARTPKK